MTKAEFLQQSAYVESFVTTVRGSRQQVADAFANDPGLTAAFLRNAEEAARANRRAQELYASGQTEAASRDLANTVRLVGDMRTLLARAAAEAGNRTWAEHLALSPQGRSLTGAVGGVVEGIGDGAASIWNGIGDGLKGLGEGALDVVKVLALVAGLAAIFLAVRAYT